jgi:eukaryotic-like serine/threonine-protein kinase
VQSRVPGKDDVQDQTLSAHWAPQGVAPAPVSLASLAVGDVVGRYVVGQRVGAGGMGVVYKAVDPTLGRTVALKVLRWVDAISPAARERLQREARALARVCHPNVVAVYDAGTVGGHVFIAMEFVDGPTLAAWTDQPSPAKPSREAIVRTYLDAARGLAAVHDAGLVHRDFKPSNVLVGADGRVRVSDFGLARTAVGPASAADRSASAAAVAGRHPIMLPRSSSTPDGSVDGSLGERRSEPATDSLDGGITVPGTILGTPAYMSPEQRSGTAASALSDQYSFCASLYAALYGEVPSLITDAAGCVDAPGRARGARVPMAIRRALVRGLAPRPDGRYPSMRELIAALERGTASHRHRRAALLAAAFAVVLLAAGLLARTWGADRAPVFAPSTDGVRLSFAVLAVANATQAEEMAWLSPAFAELIGNELAAGDQLRRLDPQRVAQAARELHLPLGTVPAADLLRLRPALDADLVVGGRFVSVGTTGLRLEVQLHDLRRARVVATVKESGPADDPWRLALAVSTRLREALGMPAPTAEEVTQARSALPRRADAAQMYATAISQLRAYEPQRAHPLLDRVVALEPDYAPGYLALSQAWRMLGDIRRAEAASRRAMQASARLPRAQRLRIEGRYHRDGSRWRQAVEIYRALLTFFPDEIDDGLALASVQTAGGDPAGAIATLDRLRQLPSPLRDDPRLDLWEATAAARLHDARRALAAAERAKQRARTRGAQLIEAEAEDMIAEALHRLGRSAEALEHYDRAATMFASLGQESMGRAVAKARASILLDIGRTREAIAQLVELVPAFERVGDDYRLAGIWNELGQARGALGEIDLAFAAYARSLQLYRKLDDTEGVANVTFNRADLLWAEERLDEAEEGFRTALAGYETVQITSYAASARHRLAVLRWRRGDLTEALTGSAAAIAALRKTSDVFSLADALFFHGMLLRDRADPEAASAFAEAEQQYESAEDPLAAAVVRLRAVEWRLDRGAAEIDQDKLRADLARLEQARRPAEVALGWRVLARVQLARGAADESEQLLAQASPPYARDRVEHGIVAGLVALRRGHRAGRAAVAEACREAVSVPLVLECRLVIAQLSPSVRAGRELEAIARDAARAGLRRLAGAARAGPQRLAGAARADPR